MNAKFLNKLILGGAALAVGAPLFLARAEEPKEGGLQQQFRRFLEGLGSTLDDKQKQQLDKALEDFQKGQGEAKPGERREFRWDSREQNSRPGENSQPRRRGRVEAVPNENENRQNQGRRAPQPNQLRQQMERQFPGLDLEQFFGEDFFGPFLREMQRMQQEGGGLQLQENEPGQPWFRNRGGDSKRSARYEKAARRAMAEFRPVVRDARESVVTLYGKNGEQLALATIVTPDGYALTKASVLDGGEGLEAEFSDGVVVGAKQVDQLKDYDLALIKLEAGNLKPIQWNTDETLPVGTLLAAPSPDEDPLAIGVLSVLARNLDSSRKGFLGITMDGADGGGVKIVRASSARPGVTPGSAADKAGLKEGDIIVAMDGKPIRSPKELTDYITSKKAEDEVHIGYRRDNEDKAAVAVLQSRDDMDFGGMSNGEKLTETRLKQLQRQGDVTARMGGRGNAVADGFPAALQNDLLIEPNQCGGPAVDLDGKAIGINIARAERTKTYAIPAAELSKVLINVASGKLTEPKDISDLKRDARKASEEIETLRDQLKKAEERARQANDALEKQQPQ